MSKLIFFSIEFFLFLLVHKSFNNYLKNNNMSIKVHSIINKGYLLGKIKV